MILNVGAFFNGNNEKGYKPVVNMAGAFYNRA
jgi:hypothetical protein